MSNTYTESEANFYLETQVRPKAKDTNENSYLSVPQLASSVLSATPDSKSNVIKDGMYSSHNEEEERWKNNPIVQQANFQRSPFI